MAVRRRPSSSPLRGSVRGVGYVVVLGLVTMLVGWLIAAVLTWTMS